MINEDSTDAAANTASNDIIIVKLGLKVGDKYSSFKEWHSKLEEASRANYVRFWKRDSRTIETAKRKVRRPLKTELEFYNLRYSCFFAQKTRTRQTLGKRKRRSLACQVESPCPAAISLRVSENGEFLELFHIIEQHNHPVNIREYQKLIPKKKTLESLLGDDDGNGLVNNSIGDDIRHKMVIKKCKQISRIASVSSPARMIEIIKNLDDYIFYLKYTTPKEEMNKIKQEKILNNNDEIDKTVAADENIQIIVEEDCMDSLEN